MGRKGLSCAGRKQRPKPQF
uniref:Uncharacterized protein n=1 Tax=Rhizophora mucronata TaxID=61149 RepID=A0A2P2J3T7_RHIMU